MPGPPTSTPWVPVWPMAPLVVPTPIHLSTPRVSSLAGNAFWNVTPMTAYDSGHWEFVKDVDSYVYGKVRLPMSQINTASVRLMLAANAVAGVTLMALAQARVADGGSINPAGVTWESSQGVTVPATAYARKDVVFPLTGPFMPGDLLILLVHHAGANAADTLAVNTLLLGAWLETT